MPLVVAAFLVARHAPRKLEGLPIPPEFQSPLVMWGPGLAAIVVFFVFPRMRSGFLSLPGSSWKRSALCFLIPICFACIAYAIESEKFSWKLGFDLVVWGFACLGEELGWRGFLQGALRPLGRIRASLLLSDVDRLALHHDMGRADFAPGDNASRSCGSHIRPDFSDRAHGIARAGGHSTRVGRSLVLSRRLFPVGRSRRGPGIDMDDLEVAETQHRACSPFAPVCRRHSLIAAD